MLALLNEIDDPWYWLYLGLLGQLIFGARFAVQWWASERARRSIVPKVFWYLSLGGSLILLAYAIHIPDPVFITGQACGFIVYSRNLVLISKFAASSNQGTVAAPTERSPRSEENQGGEPGEKNDSQ